MPYTIFRIGWLVLFLSLTSCMGLPQSQADSPIADTYPHPGSAGASNLPALISPSPNSPETETIEVPLQGAPDLSAGAAHTCLLTNTGRVLCWGANQYGQLGGGEGPYTAMEYAPVSGDQPAESLVWTIVRDLDDKEIAIRAGKYHTCALSNVGTLKCWGLNAQGQLGDGTNINRSTPVDVIGLKSDVQSLAAGAEHTCVVLDSGTVFCWGENGSGQLGTGTNQSSNKPIEVKGLPGRIVQVVAGTGFTCALTDEGELYCWGDGSNGRFGDGVQENYLSPVHVEGLDEPISMLVSGEFHLCAQSSSAALYCWGALSSDGEFNSRKPLRILLKDVEIAQLTAGSGHTCALTSTDGVRCWGDNYFGQLGDGTDLGSWEPIEAMQLSQGVMKIASGSGHVCALKQDGGVLCWGDNSSGQGGDSSLTWAWNQYTNPQYHFSLEYPAGWHTLEVPNSDDPAKIDQVWFSPTSFPPAQTNARADITLRMTSINPTPSWEPQFYEDYRSVVVQLGNVPALRFTGTNKESQREEIAVIIQNGDDFILALPNHSPESMKYFDQVLSTLKITWEGVSLTIETQPTPQPTLTATPGMDSIIKLSIDPGIADGISVSITPAYLDPSGLPENDIPEHLHVNFFNPYTTREPFTSFEWVAPWLQHQTLPADSLTPQIFIFLVERYQALSPQASERIDYLDKLIQTKTQPIKAELPMLPVFNITQDLRARAEPMGFQNGRGIRFIARYAQGMQTVVNPTVFYTFQGLSEDGKYYLAAFFPLYTTLLPSQIVTDSPAASSQDYKVYLAEISKRLEALRPEDFQPSLDLLDQLIQSISLHPE